MNRKILVLLFVMLTLGLGLVSLTAAQTSTVITYVVQPGDTLSKIAAQYCTTWQEIYDMNQATIGEDPDNIEEGMVLYIVPYCGAGSPTGVYDRGPQLHANGTVSGNVYTVAYGDTLYSIGERFGLPWEVIAEVNGMESQKVYAGQKLIIPGLSQTVPPSNTQAYISITSPLPGSYLNSPYVVSGTGGGLVEGNVVVRLKDGSGNIMAQQATTLQGANVGTGGPGTWTVTFYGVIGQPYSNGAIEAFSPETGANYSISIWFTGQ